MTNPKLPKYTITKYSNGLTHLNYYVERFNNFDVDIFFNVGSADEVLHEQFGVAHFLEHMVFNGSKQFKDRKKLEKLTADKMFMENAGTWLTITHYYVSGPNEEFETAFEILADRVFNPLLRKVDIEKERGIIIEELNRSDSVAQNVLDSAVTKRIFKSTGYAHETLGDIKSLKGMSQKILRDFHSVHYSPENAVLVTYGGIKDYKAAEIVKKVLGKIERFQIPKIKNGIKQEFEIKKSKRIEMNFDTEIPIYLFEAVIEKVNTSDELVNLIVLQELLGGGNGSIIEKVFTYDSSLTTSTGIGISPFRDCLSMYFMSYVQKENMYKVADKFHELLHSLCTEEISDIDFKRAKEFTIGQIFAGLDNVMFVSSGYLLSSAYIKSTYGFDLDYPEIYDKLVKLEKEDLQKFIRRILKNYIADKGFIDGFIYNKLKVNGNKNTKKN